ncbi:hypothetical protein IQ259_21680 [Fortiea sp. LEGE XX443]|uniref:hypothetical protein n=1 Tax=Fortiea sp. LEGE XX443 TaxID=1828611 RepID=UPI00187E3C06|nr:hypothetical protein [Fortiea sp. LEGE XX443]MBE9007600.1 hypothetical protein [Fortiea sp. LEGE XX443]
MLNRKRKQLTWAVFLLVGVGYVSAMSNFEIHYFWKSLIIVMPIQLGTAIYMAHLRWNRS